MTMQGNECMSSVAEMAFVIKCPYCVLCKSEYKEEDDEYHLYCERTREEVGTDDYCSWAAESGAVHNSSEAIAILKGLLPQCRGLYLDAIRLGIYAIEQQEKLNKILKMWEEKKDG